ncbi:MAG: sigma-54-dependent Fis family transcriptional regulator [Desulfobacterium sp.]|nr:sigma-54-dependent Fis family transcriptional regulator [Desulfobacterium sp.]
MKKLVIIGLEHTFLQMVMDQVRELAKGKIKARTVSLNELDETPLARDETALYFSKGVKAIVEKMSPLCGHYIHARREALIFNMRDLFALEPGKRILVVNDIKTNTDEMTRDLDGFGLDHQFFPYYPEAPLPKGIDQVVTAGERMLVPASLTGIPVIDIGLRFISLETVYTLFDHFEIPYTHADLARHYMGTMMMLSEKWPVLGEERFRRPAWFGIRQDTSAPFTFGDLIQESPAMKTFCRDVQKLAATQTPIHIHGRIGTGKTKISQAIHNASPFARGPFISINCAARPPEALERELFGWEDGHIIHESLFEAAENGSLCIEEINRLPEKLQAGLLQAITEGRIIHADGCGVVDVNVRLITTSSQHLEKRSPQEFNRELTFLVTQHICRVPTLPERMEDFEALMADYIATGLGKPHCTVPKETVDALKAHTWEGNVQELYHVLQHAVCMSEDLLTIKNLPYYITRQTLPDQPPKPPGENEFSTITRDITTHGFLRESREILNIYQDGKAKSRAYGRGMVLKHLQEKGFTLSPQQLRLKLERMNKLGLLIVRPGRGGTTISRKGEQYLNTLGTENLPDENP